MKRVWLPVVLVAALLTGCSQTTIRNEWRDPGYKGPAVSSVVVLCLPQSEMEKDCEDEFVNQLRDRRISAVPAYSSPALWNSMQSAMTKARESGISRLLVSRFLRKKAQYDIYPREQPMLFWPDYDMWGGYEVVENEYHVFATVLYDTATAKPVWSAESDTYSHKKERKTIRSYAKAVIKKMERQGLLR